LDEVQKFEGMVAPQNVALSMFPMGPTLKSEFPEIRNFTRINNFDKISLTYNDKKLTFPKMFWVDSTFFDIFDFKLLRGDKKTVLEKAGSIVLTRQSASKIFGREDPVGKTVMHFGDDTLQLVVTGIMENVPGNSHLQFDGLLSFNTITTAKNMENWGGNWLVTYLEISRDASISSLEKQFPAYLKKYMVSGNWKFYELFLQPLKEVHSNSANITHDYHNFHKFDKKYTYVFSIIAVIVLIIACINFMNLSTAKSAGRAKEVGIRKTVGAERFQLAIQFISESVLLSLIALLLAIILVKLFLPYISTLSQRDLDLPLFSDPLIMLIIVMGTVITGLLSGLYPAAYLSSFKPSKVLKGSPQTGKNKGVFRNVLVVGQFTGAVFLMIATVFALKQLYYMQHRDPGFNREQVVTVSLNSKSYAKYDAIKEEFQKNPLISGVTASQQRLGNNLHQSGMKFQGNGPARSLASSQVIVDPDYLKVYNIGLVAGRNFSRDYKTDNGKAFIINQTMARELLKDDSKASIQSLIGKSYGFGWMDTLGTIVGITEDFNFNSLHHKIETLTIINQKDWGFNEMSVKITGKNTEMAIAHMQSVWKKIVPDQPFEYSFLDEHFAELYRSDKQISKIVGILASLAIIISCLGLFGLASYSAERRVKEIGIRKVLGASVQSVVSLLSRDFVRLVLIANLIAWPIAWFTLSKWLQDFAYRIEISWWIFIAAGICAILIALATVSFQAIKAAIANPIKSLRSE
jgi:putative ABC transport system permease protein